MNPPGSFSKAVQAWRVRPPAEPNFRAAVWQRIEHERHALSWPLYLKTNALAAAVLLVVVAGGAGLAGRSLAQVQTNSDRARLAAVYVANLDARAQAGLWD